jgi:hypothetical protein
MTEIPVMLLRWMLDGEEQWDPVEVLWTAESKCGGYWMSLMAIPDMGYVIAKHPDPFTHGQAFDLYDETVDHIEFGRPDAGKLALALITTLINNSDQIIDAYIKEVVTGGRRAPA